QAERHERQHDHHEQVTAYPDGAGEARPEDRALGGDEAGLKLGVHGRAPRGASVVHSSPRVVLATCANSTAPSLLRIGHSLATGRAVSARPWPAKLPSRRSRCAPCSATTTRR